MAYKTFSSHLTFSWANNLDLFRNLPSAEHQQRMHCHALNNARSKRSKQYALICTAFKNKFNTTSERGKRHLGKALFKLKLHSLSSHFLPASPPPRPRGCWCSSPCGSWARSACPAASPPPRAGWAPPAASTWTLRWAPWCRSRNSSGEKTQIVISL